ncbi:MAG: amino acid ABC transporter permease, partial [Clostridia bacterium]|nr:amino acid ABC transporter permease [Clostridia bacterium]
IGIILGTLLAVARIINRKSVLSKIVGRFADIYLAVMRGTPLMVQLVIIYFIIFVGVTFINAEITGIIIAIIGFGLNSAAYVSETIRAGILSIDKGQMEAGRALGLSYGQTMKSIILPQSAKNIIPPLGNEAITLVKETSVALVIGVSEFFSVIKMLTSSTYNTITPYLFAAVVYFVTVALMTFGLTKLEKRLRKSDAR